ncbi:MAG: lactonase family protein [Planctomycetota bacterium]
MRSHRLLLVLALTPFLTITGQSLMGEQQGIASEPGKARVYVGTQTRAESKGIYLFLLDLTTGKLEPQGLVAETKNPTFLAFHPTRPLLYAVGELENAGAGGKRAGAVSAFAIDPATGKLTLLNQQPSGGPGPCHVAVDRSGKCVIVANYSGGSVSSMPIEEDGKLGPPATFIQFEGSSVNPQRQKEPHAHSANVDPANRFVFIADLGTDKIMVYRLDAAAGKLQPHDPPFASVEPGSGPRHFTFHPDGKYAYVLNELACTVTVFDYDADAGRLTAKQTIGTLPEGFSEKNTTSEVLVHPSGKFLYAANRGHDSIAIFAVNPQTGELTAVGHEPTQGSIPRNFGIDPTGQYLIVANQEGNTVTVFRIDQSSGKLSATDRVEVSVPMCIRMQLLP